MEQTQTKKQFDSLVEAKRDLETQIEAFIKESFVRFWGLNPAVKAITWTQYAPSFNDGDPCVFSVNDPYYTNAQSEEDLYLVTSEEGYTCEETGTWSDYSFGGKYHSPAPEGVDETSVKELSSILCSGLVKSVMENMFGDGARVIATRDGFKTDYYYNY